MTKLEDMTDEQIERRRRAAQVAIRARRAAGGHAESDGTRDVEYENESVGRVDIGIEFHLQHLHGRCGRGVTAETA